MIGKTLSRYRIDRRLGEGGMGVVYVARDLDLERDVALKAIRADLTDPGVKQRFWREARAAAQINHPNLCNIHEVIEAEGRLYLVLELLEGENLAERLRKGPLALDEVVRIGLELLDALAALHRHGFVHRDIKPSNVFLLKDGRVKLLDLGLVGHSGTDGTRDVTLTRTGVLMGSPQYMAPEQIRGTDVDGRADLFAAGALLHEALTGTPAFRGRDPIEVMYAVLHHRVPALGGSPELEAMGRAIGKAMAKAPEERFPDAEAFAAELRTIQSRAAARGSETVERLVKLAVLPFRMLRSDPEMDFLGPSLADAIAMSLAGIRSLLVRSPAAAARFADPTPDLEGLAKALDAEVVLIGTVLPAGGRCRVAAQLLEAPTGRVLWSQTSDVTGRDVFDIQDQLARRIVDSLQIPLSSRERSSLGSDVPASPTAYEFFLRANRATSVNSDLALARDLCLRAVQSDPGFAPAWVTLARLHRLMGKYHFESDSEQNMRLAREAIDRALALHPDLPSAHHVAAHYEVDHGEPEKAIERLLGVIRNNPNDPQGWNGLIAAFRYVGLLEESLAAYRRVRELDPEIVTSVLHTLDALGEYEAALNEPSTGVAFDRARILAILDHREEARASVSELNPFSGTVLALWGAAILGVLDHDAKEAAKLDRLMDFPDPEGLCVIARCRAKAGDVEGALRMFEKSVAGGYANVPLFARDPWLAPLRDEARFQAAVERARPRHESAIERYRGRLPAPLSGGLAETA